MKLYQNPSKFDNAAFIPDILSESENPNKVTGINIIACAKIIGITPAALTLIGTYCRAPPYCLFPIILFAY